MAGRDEAIRAAAQRHRLSQGAAAALWDALVRGGGRQAQFNHPELGGMGQWSGGMGQIGDMFNADLKARVGGACADLAAAMTAAAVSPAEAGSGQRQSQGPAGTAAPPARSSVPRTGSPDAGRETSPTSSTNPAPAMKPMTPLDPMTPMEPMRPLDFGPDWWPGSLGRPASSGAQNGVRYAVFPERARLAIERDGRVTLYDTGAHRIGGVSQAQSSGSRLAFTSEDGPVDLARLAVVEH